MLQQQPLAQLQRQARGPAIAHRRAAVAALSCRRRRCRTLAAAGASDAAGGASSSEWRWRSPDFRALQRAVPPAAREAERSALANEEAVYLIFQLELDSQLQRALNYDAYETAQQIRAKRETVDLAIRKLQERKGRAAANAAGGGGGGGGGGDEGEGGAAGSAGAAAESIDLASEGLQLRTEMQRAVEEERYEDAARLRDLLAALETRAKRAEAAAAAWKSGSRPVLRLGQRVVHRRLGYRGVVVGWDLACCEADEWLEASGAGAADSAGSSGSGSSGSSGALEHGLKQPFYHILVDVRDWRFDAAQPPVAYAAQELLAAPELVDDGASWSEVYGPGELQHPYSYILFLGQDARGDLLPCRQLRGKYSAPRRDVRRPGSEEEEGSDDEGGGGGGGGEGGGGGGGGGRGPKIPGIDMSSLM